MAKPGELEWFEGRAGYLRELYKDRDDMLKSMDDASFGIWDIPETLQPIPWIIKSPDPTFAQTNDAASRILYDNAPRISIIPTSLEKGDIADQHEKGLRWLMDNASKRVGASLVQRSSESLIDYGEACVSVIFVPELVKGMEKAGLPKHRIQRMSRQGEFIIKVVHPASVFVRRSDVGIEEVLMQTEEDPHSIVDTWGKHADGLRDAMAMTADAGDRAILYQYLSFDWQAVWVEFGGGSIEMLIEEWAWPFLPWADRLVGGSLLAETDKDRKPLLSTMYHFDEFELMNRVRTLRFSDMLRTAGAPRRTFQTSDPESGAPKIDAAGGEMYEIINEQEQVVDRRLPEPDVSMATLHAELKMDHQKATLSDLLLGGEIPSKAAFASINLVTHSALQAIKPYKQALELVLADVCELMLLWVRYTKSQIVGYGRSPDTNRPEEYLLHWEDIEPEHLYIRVEVEEALPTDHQARTVTARAQIDAGLNSHQGAMEDLGIKNAKERLDQLAEERLAENELQIRMKNRQLEADQQQMQIMQQVVMKQLLSDPAFLQQVAQQVAPQEGSLAGSEANAGVPPGEGQGQPQFAPETLIPPEAGAEAPAQFNPGATRETQFGTTGTGEEAALA